ncbi:MAG: CopG family antitoxin [Burkholderiales bacterium]
MKKLDREERSVVSAFEKGKLKSVITTEAALKRYREYARATLSKQQRVNIRLPTQALAGIRARAVEEGMPYQTLMASVLQKYVAGRFVEKPSGLTARTGRTQRKRTVA